MDIFAIIYFVNDHFDLITNFIPIWSIANEMTTHFIIILCGLRNFF